MPSIIPLPEVTGELSEDDKKILAAYLLEKFDLHQAAIAAAKRSGMEEAAKRLEELHKNHGYNSRTGKTHHSGKLVECPLTIEHSIGYYRAITEGSAHIRATGGPPAMTKHHILTAENCQHPNAATAVKPAGDGWREYRATCQHCRCTFPAWIKVNPAKEDRKP